MLRIHIHTTNRILDLMLTCLSVIVTGGVMVVGVLVLSHSGLPWFLSASPQTR